MKSLPITQCAAVAMSMLALQACTSSEIGQSKDVSPETVYQQFVVTCNAGNKQATVQARFRFAGSDGTTLVLSQPSSLTLDGNSMTVDSNEVEGAFYKRTIPLAPGNQHQFNFTGINGRQYENNFSLEDFQLINLPEVIDKRNDLILQFTPRPNIPGYRVEINAVDTDSTFTVSYEPGNRIPHLTIPAEELMRQKGKQLKLVATLYENLPLQQQTKEGGGIAITIVAKPASIQLRE